ncbi:hypothetical protein [Butyrivibrio sp. INlla14]|uniref:hypothetical protein n=1 Tax=Butyrivibrio sp. INlla14 TaxID=1520808 RepID=UPI000877478B|nr:hypothetical protein [Butyrivibrio sp. INlla14]SCY75249.1 hypothetical protein SAMN02910371_03733 [Butyrivibrio sp. INlla14]
MISINAGDDGIFHPPLPLKSPKNKKIKISDDHGKDVLYEFSRNLCNCDYVIEVVGSRPYAPREHSFIKNVYPDGTIDIVLAWTDKGLGIIVKTTGRTMRETSAIAEILKDKYCKL